MGHRLSVCVLWENFTIPFKINILPCLPASQPASQPASLPVCLSVSQCVCTWKVAASLSHAPHRDMLGLFSPCCPQERVVLQLREVFGSGRGTEPCNAACWSATRTGVGGNPGAYNSTKVYAALICWRTWRTFLNKLQMETLFGCLSFFWYFW